MFAAGEHFRLAPEPQRSYADARKWYEMAANAGDRRSMDLLGWLYRTGHGVAQSDATARLWYARAYEEG
jgi:TPR repeat protein